MYNTVRHHKEGRKEGEKRWINGEGKKHVRILVTKKKIVHFIKNTIEKFYTNFIFLYKNLQNLDCSYDVQKNIDTTNQTEWTTPYTIQY